MIARMLRAKRMRRRSASLLFLYRLGHGRQLPEVLSLAHGGWVQRSERHDYNASCWFMDARYNCQNDPRVPAASAWRHVPNLNVTQIVTWRDVVDSHGGAFSGLQELRRSCGREIANERAINVVIVGCSYLRQVYEAISCRWFDLVTRVTVHSRGPRMDKAWLKKYRRRRSAHNVSAFALLSLDTGLIKRGQQQVCQIGPTGGNLTLDSYYVGGYPQGATRPRRTCEDNIGSFELVWRNLTVRFYYAFRARFTAGGLPPILDTLGLQLSEIDLIVCDTCGPDGLHDASVLRNLNRASPIPCHQRSGDQRGAVLIDFSTVRQTLQAQMRRDIGHLYGATNGVKINDWHPCMPGIPDDEVDILFSMLLTKSRHIDHNLPADGYSARFWNETDLYGTSNYTEIEQFS